jgi:hypothetical protein
MQEKIKKALTMVRDMSMKIDKEEKEVHNFLNEMFLLLLEMDPPKEKEIVYIPNGWYDWYRPYRAWYGDNSEYKTHNIVYRQHFVSGELGKFNTSVMDFSVSKDNTGEFIQWGVK